MCAIAYGRLVKRGEARQERLRALGEAADENEKENKLVTAVAALVPAEVIALHAWY